MLFSVFVEIKRDFLFMEKRKKKTKFYKTFSLLLVDLNVGFSECDHLGEDWSYVEILHFVPLIRRFMKNMSAISAFGRFTVMHDVGDEVVASFFVVGFVLHCKNVTEIDVSVEEQINYVHIKFLMF